jgi:proline iminopeptidase
LPQSDALDLCLARLEVHYFRHGGFFEENQLLRDLHRIAHLPATIIQGRHDVLCVPLTAFRLAGAWRGAVLRIIEAGSHTAFEPGMQQALLEAVECFKRNGAFKTS